MGNVALRMEMSVDKRRQPRVVISLPLTMVSADEASIAVEVGNVAPGGIFIKTANAPGAGSRIELRFRMIGDKLCEATGRVVWSSEMGFGVAFDETNPHMDLFTRQLMKLSPNLHMFYLADILSPEIRVIG